MGRLICALTISGIALEAAIDKIGAMPLPPYIKRPDGADKKDRADYQTMFARHTGAVAAPTAGLHFTDGLKAQMLTRGISFSEVTLHVGAGTFLPVKTEEIARHKMHTEWGKVGSETIEAITKAKAGGGRIYLSGLPACRCGSCLSGTWQTGAFFRRDRYFYHAGLSICGGGYADQFSLPRSTLLMLVSAFFGHSEIYTFYQYAIERGYRFFQLWRCLFIDLSCRRGQFHQKFKNKRSIKPMTDSRPEFDFTVQARDGFALDAVWSKPPGGQWIRLFLCQWALLPLSRR